MTTLRLTFLVIFLFSNYSFSQIKPTKIEITKNIYVGSFAGDSESLYKTQKKVIKNEKQIEKLKKELSIINNESLLSQFGIDTIEIKKNPYQLISYYENRNKIVWNQQQKDFITKELSKISNYTEELENYFDNGCCYSMHNFYRNEYIISVYENEKIVDQFKSRKFVFGFKFPWTNKDENKNYNFKIDNFVDDFFDENSKAKSPLKNNELLKYLVNKIIDKNINTLYQLSAYSYLNEINDLKDEFNVKSFEEVYARGRYIWNEPKTIKITLHNEKMLPNVNIQFLVSVIGKSLYKKDSLLSNYDSILKKVQNINFIQKYLSEKPDSQLDIYFFNNKPINEYNIDGVNKNPEKWKKHYEYVESLKWFEKNKIKPSFDINEAIKVSEKNDCGCNYRFDRKFIEKAIFFEIIDKKNNSSVWFLLPDNKVLLYLSQGEKILNYDYNKFGKYSGVNNPCFLFDTNGNIIEK